ncbi:MAG: hypothetical protein ACUVWX_11120 [Kiritimatiellia bacterium]
MTEPVPQPAVAPEGKRRTSRIPLESVLSPEVTAQPEQPATPKTIRLKRPEEDATVKLAQPAAPAQAEQKAVMGKTARLDEQVPEGAAATITRRKTIKVKRPAPQAPGVTGLEKGPMGVPVTLPVAEEPSEEECHWAFPVLAIAAILVLCVTIYVFAAQAFGPNISLTRLSYGAPELDLPWPDKIRPQQ